jgi:large subunit ribosomal protein L10
MAKTRKEKKAMLDQYKDILSEKPNYFLVDIDKAGMTEITELKKALSDTGGQFVVLKNTLFKIAAQEADQPTKLQELTDATAMVVCGDDPTEAAKALKQIQDEHEVMGTRLAVLFGDIAEAAKVDELARIPSRDELYAKIVGSLNSPLSGFVQVMQGNVRDLVYALSEIAKAKGETGTDAPAGTDASKDASEVTEEETGNS